VFALSVKKQSILVGVGVAVALSVVRIIFSLPVSDVAGLAPSVEPQTDDA